MTCPGHPNGGMCYGCAPWMFPSPEKVAENAERFKALRELGRGMRFQLAESAPDVSQPANPLGLPPIFNGRQFEAIEYVAAHPNCVAGEVAHQLGMSHSGALLLLNGLFARKVLGRQFSTSGRISHWYYDDGKPAPFLPGKPAAEAKQDHLRPVQATAEPATPKLTRKLTPRPLQPPPAPLYTDDELDDYWSEHPNLTRKEAERELRRDLRERRAS